MSRNSILSFIIVAAGTGALLATTAKTQFGVPKAYVNLQPTTPGTSQSGHANISGTLRASQLVGGGAGIANVNADLLDGFNSTAFLQSVPVPLSLSADNQSTVVSVTNTHSLAGATAITGHCPNGGVTYGVRGSSSGLSGRGVSGYASSATGNTVGVQGESNSSGGIGVQGQAYSSIGASIGVQGSAFSPDGLAGHFIGRSHFTGNVGIGVLPGASRLQVDGNSADVMVINNTGTGRGILVNTNSDTAIWANTTSGFAAIDARNASTSAYAVFGLATAATGGSVGVLGQTSSPGGWGVYSFGNMGASGVKPFRIDHPFDPENKYLLHYASESPMPQNFYVGNTVTDSQGFAWVELPDYFSEINTNFKYQLTVVGKTFAQAIVYEEIVDGRFQIRTNQPNIKVSWRVDADRNDLFVRDRKPQDVVEKQGRERGTYQHPEFYGMPKERGTNYRPETDVTTTKPKR